MYQFSIPGRPQPQKQTRKGIYGFYDPSSEYKRSLQKVAKIYAPEKPMKGAIMMCLSFYFEPPASLSKKKKAAMVEDGDFHTKRPDVDNLAYIVTNALKEIFYEDDSQIVFLGIDKHYGEINETRITIMDLEKDYAPQ